MLCSAAPGDANPTLSSVSTEMSHLQMNGNSDGGGSGSDDAMDTSEFVSYEDLFCFACEKSFGSEQA